MSSERNKVIPAVFLVLQRNGEILMQRRFNTGFQDGKYTFVSGHVGRNESPTQAVCREAKEEAGIEVKKEDLHFEQVLYRRGFDNTQAQFDNTQPERVDFFFSATQWEGEPHITEPEKCDDLCWFPLTAIPKEIFPVVEKFLDNYRKHSPFEESGY